MSNFKLSKKSISRLDGVDSRLVDVVQEAIKISLVDFGVLQGLRTLDEQKELLEKGKTKTLNSKHLTGDAVDLFAYPDNNISWAANDYYPIVDAMKIAAKKLNVTIRWGGCWRDIDKIDDPKQAVVDYINKRNKMGRKPFVDVYHFEIVEVKELRWQ